MNNTVPLVSISVVTYNHKDYIEQCLDSILMQQTTFPIEVILGEDESNDGTREICIDYAKKYPDKIKLFLRSRKDVIYINGNPTGRYNMIENLKACKGKYIALCEGDDYWTDPFKLQKQVDFLEATPNYIIHGTAAKILREDNRREEFAKMGETDETFMLKDFYCNNHLVTATVIFKNMDIDWKKQLNNSLSFGDWFLYVLLLHHSGLMAYRSVEVTSVYRIHRKGIMESMTFLRNKTQNLRQIFGIKSYVGYKNTHYML